MKRPLLIGAILAFSLPAFGQEQAPGSRGFLALTAAYSERFKEILGAEIIARNLFRLGIDLNLAAKRNDLGHQWTLDLRKNRTLTGGSLPDESAFRFGIRGHEFAWDDSLFHTKREAIYIGFSYDLAPDTNLVVDLESYVDDLSNVAVGTSPLVAAEAGEVRSSGVATTFTYGSKNFANITRGTFFAQARGEFYGISGDAKWIAYSGKLAYAFPFTPQAKVKFSAEGGIAEGRSGYALRITDRAFLSSNQLRGFQFGGIGPIDTDGTTITPLGGRKYLTTSVEIEHDIAKLRQANISASVFFDAGSVWDLTSVNGGFVDPIDDSFFLRQSAGIALNLNTDFGALTLAYAKPIKQRITDRTQEFSLSFSLGF